MKRLFLLLCAVCTISAYAAEQITIAEFLYRADTKTTYRLCGVVRNPQNNKWGNFTLEDETGSIYIFGLKNADGQTQQFLTMDIAANDTVTLEGAYFWYEAGGYPEIKNAQYISHTIALPEDGIHFPASFRKGWAMYEGQTLTFEEPFYVVEVPSTWNKLTISTERLQAPDEVSYKLASGDSTYYKQHAAHNAAYKVSLTGTGDGYFNSMYFRCGAVLYPLRAKVVGERELVLEEPLPLYNYTPVTTPPSMPGASVKVCGANIRNYFITLGKNGADTEANLEKQNQKIASAFINIDADIYALCEIESRIAASEKLVAKLNELAGADIYAYVDNSLQEYTALSVGFLYRKDKVAVTDVAPYFPYTQAESYTWNKRLIMREFKELSSGETFVVSVNHLKAKTSDDWVSTQYYNTTHLLNGLEYVTTNSYFGNNRILIVGDFNGYTYEKTIQRVIEAGYKDILPHDNPLNDYSYVYQGETGYLDRAFASADLQPYVVDVQPYHINTDYHYRHEYKYETETFYRYSDHDPIIVGLNFEKIPMAIDAQPSETNTTVKVIIDGHLYIINNGVRYTVTGLRAE